MAHTNENFEYPHAGWWNTKETIAKGMTVASLEYAMCDCQEAAKAMPVNEGKYMDENSVYNRELIKRIGREPRKIHLAQVLYNNGTSVNLGMFFADDRKAHDELFDLMQNMCQKDENINSFGIDQISAVGDLQKVCQ